ncbi:hypothetical protein MHO82_24995 [Vibrio sp. Of7-15]|uniref:SH3 domain-containing protein n=1 Tax=Vibrio sp. Of7-15 TaxID=2724879 RepID=UPI001EF3991F|nr:SH3 domain-containing protein [Vibrio sp. Of7-15]MCG7500124.1 hypothetical protein [Vibrio sp. Of7-15]
MDVVAIKAHVTEYPNPIFLKKGEQVVLGEMDDEYPNWIFITTEAGSQGWAPIQYVDESSSGGKTGILLHDYDAVELNTTVGEKFCVQFELNAWFRVTRENGDIGWVPADTVKPI